MKKRGRPQSNENQVALAHECHDLIAHWILKILIDLNTLKGSRIQHDAKNLRAIGLSEEECEDLEQLALLTLIKQQKATFSAKKITLPSTTESNLSWLQSLVGLSDVEMDILLFVLCIKTNPQLESIAGDLGGLTVASITHVLGVILDRPYKNIAKALSRKGVLIKSGLLKLDKDNGRDLESLFEIPEGCRELLSIHADERQQLLDQFYSQSKTSVLTLKDYPHIKEDTQLLKRYLKSVLGAKQTGVNVLIYGEPGTGKTELVSVLAKSLKTTLHQVSNEHPDGDSMRCWERICAYKMAQRILGKNQRSFLLFDEIEDIFPSEHGYIDVRSKTPGKAWLNNQLENNEIPTFWVSNDIKQIDTAYIRRFDYVIELKTPPKSIRKKIIKQNLGELTVSEHWLEQLSQNKHLAPGVISRAAKVISMSKQQGEKHVQHAMDRVLNNTLNAMGHKVEKTEIKTSLDYQLDALNPSQDLEQLVDGLRYVTGVRLCMYGPPGTGKTAFGHYISSTLDKPLIVKRASDILSPYLGIAEKNMALMFEEAKDEHAVLLLDEADSFLQDRTTLKQSWEVSQVNELLTQMESFEGLFVCSTNLMDKLDAAVLRRFDFKIKLDYLKTEQAWRLFCHALGWTPPQAKKNAVWYQPLSAFNNLTPGDFANVLRQRRLYKQALTANKLLDGLKQESLFKKDSHQSREIGFHATL